jgi:hypothetical protein
MLIVEVLLDEKSGKMMSMPCTRIEKDPSVPHCTILYLAHPITREVSGQPPFQVHTLSVPSMQIHAWYEGQSVSTAKSKDSSDDIPSELPPGEIPPA